MKLVKNKIDFLTYETKKKWDVQKFALTVQRTKLAIKIPAAPKE